MGPRMYSAKQAQEWLARHGIKVSHILIYRLAQKHGVMVGRRWYISEKVLQDVLEGKVDLSYRAAQKDG